MKTKKYKSCEYHGCKDIVKERITDPFCDSHDKERHDAISNGPVEVAEFWGKALNVAVEYENG